MARFDPKGSVESLLADLEHEGLRRAMFWYDDATEKLASTRSALAPLVEHFEQNHRDFARHRAAFLEIGRESGALLTAFLHQVRRGQGAGGVRHWRYETVGDLLDDGLRLSRGMGQKSALAGLYWGGGKGIICRQLDAPLDDEAYRRRLYRDYGSFVSSLCGAYVAAEDVGTRPSDMRSIHETTRFATCIPEDSGGSGNPSQATAKGVVCAIEAALEFLGLGPIAGKAIAMQGAGNVGRFMIDELCKRGATRIVASEVSATSIEALRERYRDEEVELRAVSADDTSIFAEPCDVFVPNALGGVLHPGTIALLDCKLVCGAANNQLLDDQRDDRLLRERGITYVPDFVANRMGIVQCANEQYGSLPEDPAIHRHFDRTWENSLHQVTQRVLRQARDTRITSTEAARRLADELMETDHPLWPGRTQRIIDALRDAGWDRH